MQTDRSPMPIRADELRPGMALFNPVASDAIVEDVTFADGRVYVTYLGRTDSLRPDATVKVIPSRFVRLPDAFGRPIRSI